MSSTSFWVYQIIFEEEIRNIKKFSTHLGVLGACVFLPTKTMWLVQCLHHREDDIHETMLLVNVMFTTLTQSGTQLSLFAKWIATEVLLRIARLLSGGSGLIKTKGAQHMTAKS